jgi:hypothetical protein
MSEDFYERLEFLEAKLERGEEIHGDNALIVLATEFANETHGNYEGETLFRRAKLQDKYTVTLKKRPEKDPIEE